MQNPTRGDGLFEGMLARWRARTADRLIPDSLRTGAILDIGCGTRPDFLLRTRFAQKTGVDRCPSGMDAACLARSGIRRLHHDVGAPEPLPFDSNTFSAVTLLSVIEHLEPASVPPLFAQIRRVLAPGGLFVCVTPPPFSDRVLRVLAALRLLSPEEINEHKAFYGRAELAMLMEEAGFAGVRTGRFELGMNQWVTGIRPRPELE